MHHTIHWVLLLERCWSRRNVILARLRLTTVFRNFFKLYLVLFNLNLIVLMCDESAAISRRRSSEADMHDITQLTADGESITSEDSPVTAVEPEPTPSSTKVVLTPTTPTKRRRSTSYKSNDDDDDNDNHDNDNDDDNDDDDVDDGSERVDSAPPPRLQMSKSSADLLAQLNPTYLVFNLNLIFLSTWLFHFFEFVEQNANLNLENCVC